MPLYNGAVEQLECSSACHAEGRGFESRQLRHLYADIAQLVAQLTCNQ